MISNAYAQTNMLMPSSSFMDFLPLIGVCAVFYFVLLRPQQKRAKETKAMLISLQKGDEIVTAGGELGRVSKVGDTYINLEIAENVTILIQKSSVQTVLPKGTIKSI